MRIVLALAGLLMGTACADTADRRAELDSPFAPAVNADATPEVEPMTVGHRLMAAGEYQLAIKSFHRAAANEGMTTEVLSSLGSAHLELGRLEQAETLLRQATEAAPEDPMAWNNLGVVLMEKGEYPEAEQMFRRAFAFDSGQSDMIRENLRLALAKLENPAYALENNGQFALDTGQTSGFRLVSEP